VEVFSEETLTGARKLTSRAYLTFVAVDRAGNRVAIPPLQLDTDEERQRARDAETRRAARLDAKNKLGSRA
jgi:acyl-CoA hydrolase